MEIQTSGTKVLRIFRINLNKLINRDDITRWVGAVQNLMEYSEVELLEARNYIMTREGYGKPPLYYLEGARRVLNEMRSHKLKTEPVPPIIKQIMKQMA